MAAAVRTGGELADLVELRRLLGRRHWDVADRARDVGHAIGRFRSRSSEFVPALPPHEVRGTELADRLDELARRVERTRDALAAADNWIGQGVAGHAFDAESARQAAWLAWRQAPGTWGRAQRWAATPGNMLHDSIADVRRLAGRGEGAAARFGAGVGDDAGRLARGWGAVSNSRIGAVGRLASRGVAAGGIVLGGVDAWQGYQEGDTEQMVTGGLAAAAGAAMLVPCPPVQVVGAVVSVGLLVYEHRDRLAAAGRAVTDAARRDIARKVEFARDVAGTAGDAAAAVTDTAGDIADAAWDAVKGLF